MATDAVTSRLLPVNFTSKSSPTDTNGAQEDAEKTGDSVSGRCLRQTAFVGRGGRAVTVTPLVVDLRRLLQSRPQAEVAPGVSGVIYQCSKLRFEIMHAPGA